jgi:hypothetical protein
MKAHVKAKWSLSDGQRRSLGNLLATVGPGTGEDDPRFMRLLEAWELIKAPWDLSPAVCCYRCRGGAWVYASAAAVVAAIGRHVEVDT